MYRAVGLKSLIFAFIPTNVMNCLYPKLLFQHLAFNHKTVFNPFAPEPPVRIQVLSTLCDVISFNSQGQLSSLTCAE